MQSLLMCGLLRKLFERAAVNQLNGVPLDLSRKLADDFCVVRVQVQSNNQPAVFAFCHTNSADTRQPQQFRGMPALYFAKFCFTGYGLASSRPV